MWLRWFPWKFIVRRAALGRGFLDPISVLGHLHSFQKPSEVSEPLELLRAGMVFHARGLINTKAIQHNLDWIWPYWVARQFDPADRSFIPRAFSITHVNLTHRNWSAVGLPDLEHMPIIDPRGLLTPFWDSWSLDAWIIGTEASLLPSQSLEARQDYLLEDPLSIETQVEGAGSALKFRTWVEVSGNEAFCCSSYHAVSEQAARLALSIRPTNPEGVSFIKDLACNSTATRWIVNGEHELLFETQPDDYVLSEYRAGDVYAALTGDAQPQRKLSMNCEVGMATAAVVYEMKPGEELAVSCRIPLPSTDGTFRAERAPGKEWSSVLEGLCRVAIPEKFQRLYDLALHTLIILAPNEVYPGPYTYRRFWFRDAAFMVHALLVCGMVDRAERVLATFPSRQTRDGYYRSQEGEWDSNGQVLWILERYRELSGTPLPDEWLDAAAQGARWIRYKRLPNDINQAHAGLFPPGFSAEHLGPNDYYYWDDFWGLGGLLAAVRLFSAHNRPSDAEFCREEAQDFAAAIERSLETLPRNPKLWGIPASPYRRMDAGAIGSIVPAYPLQIWDAKEPRILASLEAMIKQCFFEGAFFQEMIHSGINVYLTLQIAQILMRAGDSRYLELINTAADLASPTGQWPEAIHPATGGGCMGDGQHGWAAVEWLLIIRNAFLREEAEELVLGSGISDEWLAEGKRLSCGPTLTRFGRVSTAMQQTAAGLELELEAQWRNPPNRLTLSLPGYLPVTLAPDFNKAVLSLEPLASRLQ